MNVSAVLRNKLETLLAIAVIILGILLGVTFWAAIAGSVIAVTAMVVIGIYDHFGLPGLLAVGAVTFILVLLRSIAKELHHFQK